MDESEIKAETNFALASQPKNTMSYAKALQYAKYRLPYSAEAVRFVIKTAGAGDGAVADIGAGTGLLTQHFTGQVARLYLVEPEDEMRRLAGEIIGRQGINTEYIAGTAERTFLPDQSVDLIVAANSIHRFQPEAALEEFRRILRPGGWLAVFSYDDEFNFLRDNMNVGRTIEEYTTRLNDSRHTLPLQYFYNGAKPVKYLFPQELQEGWEEYWGAAISGMEAPEEHEEWFRDFRQAHWERFESLQKDGEITVKYSTEVWLGQPHYR
ncbi:class I SAM-dependent methyltransferase [Paenibacillus sp. 22594]|uniref:class I SAM-dependent methyltransferase n=1 Tax=Paenibacillus sp. 22594 TaxID=3453947 RepID=UPI003F84735A